MVFDFFKKRIETIGLPPGSLVHIGEQKVDTVKLSIINYDKENLTQKDLKKVEESLPFRTSPGVTWLNITGLHDVQTLQKIGNHFGIHPLVTEDILNTGHQPKTEIYEDHIFIIAKMIKFNSEKNEVIREQVSIILGKNYVITFQEVEGDIFDPVRKRLMNSNGRLRDNGPDYLTYALLDVIVDNYYLIIQALDEIIEELDEKVLQATDKSLMSDIQKLKRETFLLRKTILPLRVAIDDLMKEESNLMGSFTLPYLSDLYDHANQVVDNIVIFREMVSGTMDVYLSTLSHIINDVMKILTIIATIFIPLTFLAGIYGMNFEYMPELKWAFGYPLIWVIMIALGSVSLIFFRKKGWLYKIPQMIYLALIMSI
jgi:magnesium transporter